MHRFRASCTGVRSHQADRAASFHIFDGKFLWHSSCVLPAALNCVNPVLWQNMLGELAKMKRLTVLVAATLAIGVIAGAANAQISFDPQTYRQMADANSASTIAPGTKITLQNWQQYKQFMPLWLQAAYGGNYHWHLGPEPDFTINVTPSSHFPVPAKMRENSEKYGAQTQLQPLPTGGFLMKNYVAGIPFPSPAGPNAGVKILYNTWATFRPFVLHFYSTTWLVDRFGNVSSEQTDDTFYQLTHLSEPNMPVNLPYAKGAFYVSRFMVTEPEQSKYTTELTIQPDDASKPLEIYVFLPSLRRSLRLSSAARCAPTLGTDFIEDDNSWLPVNFKVNLIGEKRLLVPIAVADLKIASDPRSYVGGRPGEAQGTFPGWGRPDVVKWQLRDLYVLNIQWLSNLGPYCEPQRIFYVDKENWIAPYTEAYDNNNKFWKLLELTRIPTAYRSDNTILNDGDVNASGYDFQNSHATVGVDGTQDGITIDENVAAEYRDAEVLATPGGLSRIMK